jgi:hypothetical protein
VARQVSECHVLFTPTNDSWLNQVKIRFGVITRQAIKRGTFAHYEPLATRSASTSRTGITTRSPSPGQRLLDMIITKLKLLHRDFKKLLA